MTTEDKYYEEVLFCSLMAYYADLRKDHHVNEFRAWDRENGDSMEERARWLDDQRDLDFLSRYLWGELNFLAPHAWDPDWVFEKWDAARLAAGRVQFPSRGLEWELEIKLRQFRFEQSRRKGVGGHSPRYAGGVMSSLRLRMGGAVPRNV